MGAYELMPPPGTGDHSSVFAKCGRVYVRQSQAVTEKRVAPAVRSSD
jgi:hypothetical protein